MSRQLIARLPVLLCFMTVLAVGAGVAMGQDRTRGAAYLGAFLGDVTEDRARELKLTETRGAVVGRVVAESPAAKAGLKEGDVILGFRGEPVAGREEFYRLLSDSRPNRIITLSISRGGVVQNLHVALGERRGALQDGRRRIFAEADETRAAGERMAQEAEELRQKGDEKQADELAAQAAQLIKQGEEMRAEIEKQLKSGQISETQGFTRTPSYNLNANRHLPGATVTPLSEQLAAHFNVAGGGGVLVTEVRPGGLVERAGIKAGDCITAVGGQRIYSAQDLTRQIQRLAQIESAGQKVEAVFSIVRDRREVEVKAEIGGR